MPVGKEIGEVLVLLTIFDAHGFLSQCRSGIVPNQTPIADSPPSEAIIQDFAWT
jgi:hypothetical protein